MELEAANRAEAELLEDLDAEALAEVWTRIFFLFSPGFFLKENFSRYIPSRELTYNIYPSWGKGKSSSKVPWYMLVPRSVPQFFVGVAIFAAAYFVHMFFFFNFDNLDTKIQVAKRLDFQNHPTASKD